MYEKLQALQESDWYPFHMPGHKRNLEKLPKWFPYGMDITEIEGFDNLHDAEDLLADCMKEIADFRGADQSFLLVNGSSCGLLAGIASCVWQGDEILVARNCHKAVYHSIFANQLQPHYIYPQMIPNWSINCGISPDEIEKMCITYPNIRLLVLTSPTYEGVVSDIKAIVSVAHKYGVIVLVDQAHGAHLEMGSKNTPSAVSCGADLVVESVHKTLPSPTQTALLHVQGNLVDRFRLQQWLAIYQTSSPSYPLMAGIAWCMDYCKEHRRDFLQYEKNIAEWRKRIEDLRWIRLFDPLKEPAMTACAGYDSGKFVLGVRNGILTGGELYQQLREDYHLQLEMAAATYCIAMTSVMDQEEGFARLYQALQNIDQHIQAEWEGKGDEIFRDALPDLHWVENPTMMSIYQAEQKEGIWCDLKAALGHTAKGYIYLYPPGVPLLTPGEEITEALCRQIEELQKVGLQVKGLKNGKIYIVKETVITKRRKRKIDERGDSYE